MSKLFLSIFNISSTENFQHCFQYRKCLFRFHCIKLTHPLLYIKIIGRTQTRIQLTNYGIKFQIKQSGIHFICGYTRNANGIHSLLLSCFPHILFLHNQEVIALSKYILHLFPCPFLPVLFVSIYVVYII